VSRKTPTNCPVAATALSAYAALARYELEKREFRYRMLSNRRGIDDVAKLKRNSCRSHAPMVNSPAVAPGAGFSFARDKGTASHFAAHADDLRRPNAPRMVTTREVAGHRSPRAVRSYLKSAAPLTKSTRSLRGGGISRPGLCFCRSGVSGRCLDENSPRTDRIFYHDFCNPCGAT
jgi:hypothetical protein